MKVTEFVANNGETSIVVTEHQRRALDRIGYFANPVHAKLREFHGEPTYSDWEVAKLLGQYDGMTGITAVGNSAVIFSVADPLRPHRREECATFALALKCARHRFGCDVLMMPAEQVRERGEQFQHLFSRLAADAGMALLIVDPASR